METEAAIAKAREKINARREYSSKNAAGRARQQVSDVIYTVGKVAQTGSGTPTVDEMKIATEYAESIGASGKEEVKVSFIDAMAFEKPIKGMRAVFLREVGIEDARTLKKTDLEKLNNYFERAVRFHEEFLGVDVPPACKKFSFDSQKKVKEFLQNLCLDKAKAYSPLLLCAGKNYASGT